MKKIVFLDRDGTLNLDKGYTYKLKDYKLLEGVKKGLKKLVENGFDLIVLTSQSGIGRGMYNEEDYKKFTDHFVNDLKSDGVEVLGIYHCPHHSEYGRGKYKIDCDCRKPKPGLMCCAAGVNGPFDYENSWAVGDSVRDLEMAKNFHIQIKTILIPKNYGTKFVEPVEQSNFSDYQVDNFQEAVNIILGRL